MTLLSIDPSITCIGYALFGGPGELFECGLIRPQSRKAPVSERCYELFLEITEMVRELAPERIVVEVPTGHVSRGRPGAGLTTYGMAVGAVWCAARLAMVRPDLAAYDERTWTRSRTKRSRIARIAAAWPQYRAADDPGGDVADAIGLGEYDYGQIAGSGTRGVRT